MNLMTAVFERGKQKFIITLTSNPNLWPLADLFLISSANREAIIDAGNQILLHMRLSLNSFRQQRPQLNNIRLGLMFKFKFN